MKKLLIPSIISLTLVFLAFCVVNRNQNSNVNTEVINYLTEVDSNTDEVHNGGGSEVVEEKKIVDRSPETIKYFNEIVYKNEFGGKYKTPFKWKSDMKIYVDGQRPEYLMVELRRIVAELNIIINPIEIKIVSSPSQANYFIYFGSHTGFATKYNLIAPERLKNNWGYFEIYHSSGNMYVDLNRNNDTKSHKHLLREELTQSLGLFNDSYEYPESIFYQGWTTTTEFTKIDRELIDMLYND